MDATSPISKSTNESETTIKVKESPNTKGGKESLKLRITTNHVDGTSRIVSNNNSLTTNHNHVIKEKDGSGSLNSKHGGSPDKKDSKTSNANGSHGEKNKEHKNNSSSTPKSTSTPSSKPKDSNSKQPKENNHSLNNSSSKDEKHKENSVSKTKDVSKVKDGSNNHHNNSINKPKVSGTPNSTSKPSGHSKTPSSSVKPKEGGSSKPKEGSSSSDSKQKDGSGSKNTSSALSSKPKTSSSSTPADKGKTSSSHSTSSKSKESSSKTPSSSTSSSTKPSEKKPSSGSSGSGSSLNKSADKSTSESKSKKVEVTPVKEKQKDKENHNVKDSSKVKVKEESKEKLKEESKEKLKETKKENKQIKKEESSPVKVKVENVKDDKKHVSKVKEEQMSDDDIPLAARIMSQDKKKKVDKDGDGDWEDDEPLKKKMKREASTRKRKVSEDSDDEPISKKVKKTVKKESKQETVTATGSSTKRKKKAEEEQEVWKWWEEEKLEDGVKWKTLEHKGPVFAPDYEPLPSSVKFFYNKKEMKLSEPAEEVATFYAKLLDHDYTSKEMFNQNFFKDWRKTMTSAERETISDLKKCDFRQMCNYFLQKTEERKAMTKEEKQVIKKQNEEIQNEYGFCIIDGHKEKIGNFKIEPPGLFRGRGEHPKMGRHKHRIRPEDVMINCSKKSKIPSPPKGHKWKEVKHDNTVTWLACWQENIQNSIKYVMLNPSSKLKGEKDWQKYEIARKLKLSVDKIRKQYQQDFRSKEMKVRQRAVAMYFIDKLALRAGNEKEEGETADTVGCCSLRVEHITLDEEKDGMQNVVSFDFLGKDSIRYVNTVAVEKRVFKNIRIFMDHKQPGDDLFDRLNTAILNKHLNELMEGLTAKVFRTFNASKTLQEQLELLTNPNDSIAAKILSYNRANRAVAILCNHQRAVPKTFDKSMGNLQAKIQAKKDEVKKAQKEYKEVKREKGAVAEKKKKALERAKEQLFKLELQATDKEENKQIALGTSKLNYLDPRISVAWCKKFDVPIEKVYNKTQRDKFRWAIEMAGPDFVF